MPVEKIALQPYLEKVDKLLAPLGREELLGLLTRMAELKPTNARVAFLTELRALVADLSADTDAPKSPKASQVLPAIGEEALEAQLDAIRGLGKNLAERREIIESGDYDELEDFDEDFGDYHSRDHCSYDEPEMVTDFQQDEFNGFMEAAGDYFLDGNSNAAKLLYDELFLIDGDNESELAIRDEDVAKYCRCIYEINSPEDRLRKFAASMNLDSPFGQLQYATLRDYTKVVLADVIKCRTEPLPEYGRFLDDWRRLLEEHKSIRARVLLIEAMFLRGDFAAIDKWLEANGGAYPFPWIFQLKLLADAEKWTDLITSGWKALDHVADDRRRAEIAEALIEAAGKSREPQTALRACRVLLEANKDTRSVRRLFQITDERDAVGRELGAFEQILVKGQGCPPKPLAVVKVLLGDFEGAIAVAEKEKTFRWDYGEASIAAALAAVAAALFPTGAELPEAVRDFLLSSFCGKSRGMFREDSAKADDDASFRNYLVDTLRHFELSPEQSRKLMDWGQKTVLARVDSIVSNKHRALYGSAAQLAALWARVLKGRGDVATAQAFIDDMRNKKYNRFPAFRRELDNVRRG